MFNKIMNVIENLMNSLRAALEVPASGANNTQPASNRRHGRCAMGNKLSALCAIALLAACEQKLPDSSENNNTNDVNNGADTNGGNTDSTDGTTDGVDGNVEAQCKNDDDCNDNVSCTTDSCRQGWCEFTPDHGECSNNDGNPCTQAHCILGKGCRTDAVSNGTECASGKCYSSAVCQDGNCQTSGFVNCDDGNQCTADFCDDINGCQHTQNTGAACNDGDSATENDKCTGSGVCLGNLKVAQTCTVPVDCVTDSKCTILDCIDGECQAVGSDNTKCDDGVACTVDSCSTAGGCNHVPNVKFCGGSAAFCDTTYGCVECTSDWDCGDDNSCTIDLCRDAKCTHVTEYDFDNDGKIEDDEVYPESTDKLPCADDNACYLDSICHNGECVFGDERECDDNNDNTFDTCDSDFGCLYLGGDPTNEDEEGNSDGADGSDGSGNGTTEKCNGIDDDNDGQVDEYNAQGCTVYYKDQDNDGWGSPAKYCMCAPSGDFDVKKDSDCNDTNASVKPDATEVSNGIDDDCDGSIDEGTGGGNTEKCDNVDNDNDGSTDEEGANGCVTYYYDNDNDGFGSPNGTKCYCAGKQPGGGKWLTVDSDCNDNNSSVKPGTSESCNSIDDDCDGVVDENCNGSGGSSGLTCNITLTDSKYRLTGMSPSMSCSGGWCTNQTTMTVSGSNVMYINAECSPLGTCGNNANYGVNDPIWSNNDCTTSDINVIDSVFSVDYNSANGYYESASCRCEKVCWTGNVGSGSPAPNFRCVTK